MHTLTSFAGTTFASIDWDVGFPQAQTRGQFDVSTRVTARTGNTAILGPGPISPRRISVLFVYTGDGDVRGAVDQLIGLLNPLDMTPRALVGQRYDGAEVTKAAYVEMPPGFTSDDEVNTVPAVFVSEEPAWSETSEREIEETVATSPASITVTNEGTAVVRPRYRLSWDDQHSAVGTVVGQRYMKRLTLTNDQDRAVAPFPFEISLGDTAALTTTKAQADGDDLRVIINGRDVERKLRGWDLTQSYVFVVVPGLDAGESISIDVVYGNSSATSPPVWTDPDPDKPIIDMDAEAVTATGGSTTTLVKASWGLDVSGTAMQYRRAWVTGLTGDALNIGVTREVQTHTTDTLTFTAAWPAAIASGHTFILRMSSNDRWIYDVRQTDRDSEYDRGRWYIDRGGSPPNDIQYDAPGSWKPELVLENNDSFGQSRYTTVDVGGGDNDYFALLNAKRMVEGNDKRVQQAGTADGVSAVFPYTIDQLYAEYQLQNPNGICLFFLGVRGSGSEDWAEAITDTTASDSLTTYALNGAGFLDIEGNFPGVYQMVMALLPRDQIDIDPTWARETGTATGGTTTTTDDSTKVWVTNQFDNGSILMISGANKGKAKAISSNDSNTITHAAFSTANADGDRYLLTNARLTGHLRDGNYLVIDLNSGDMTNSGLGAELDVYDASMELWVGDDGPNGDPTGQHRALFGYATAGQVYDANGDVDADHEPRRLLLAFGEQIELDAETCQIRIWDTTEQEYTRTLTDPEVVVQTHDGESWKRSSNWMPLVPGDNKVWVKEQNIGQIGINVHYFPRHLGG